MEQLRERGRYEIPEEMRAKLGELFYGGFCGEEDTASTVAQLYRCGYLIDTHTRRR